MFTVTCDAERRYARSWQFVGLAMPRWKMLAAAALCTWTFGAAPATAQGLLDGQTFSGMIGPAETPDLEDRLYFRDGQFWSDICIRCGFLPGPYSAEATGEGIRFTGRLDSESRGSFDYRGVVRPDGDIEVSIRWERKRWYWTAQREIVFRGAHDDAVANVTLEQVNLTIESINPDSDPQCARF